MSGAIPQAVLGTRLSMCGTGEVGGMCPDVVGHPLWAIMSHCV